MLKPLVIEPPKWVLDHYAGDDVGFEFTSGAHTYYAKILHGKAFRKNYMELDLDKFSKSEVETVGGAAFIWTHDILVRTDNGEFRPHTLSQIAENLLHEVIHIAGRDVMLPNDDLGERFVRGITGNLLEILRKNPELAYYLLTDPSKVDYNQNGCSNA